MRLEDLAKALKENPDLAELNSFSRPIERRQWEPKTSNLERSFLTLWQQLGGAEPVQEYPFHGDRKWRFDFAWPDLKIAVECEGGIWTGGRHVRGTGYTNDCEKYNAATAMGWQVYRVTTDMLANPDRYIQPIVDTLK